MRLLALAVTLVALTQRAVPEALAQEHTEYPHLAQGFTAALDLPPEGHAQGDRQTRVVADAERFQAWLHAQQHPTDCATSRIYAMENHPYGLASELHVQAHSLLEALAAGYVLVAPVSPVYVSSQRCPQGGWTCLFRPLSRCTAADAATAAARNPPELDCSAKLSRAMMDALDARDTPGRAPLAACEYTRHKSDNVFQSEWWYWHSTRAQRGDPNLFKTLSGVLGDYGTAFYLREAVRYVSRPNVELIEFTQWLRADVRGLPTDLSKVVGMHVRRGDATGLMGRPRWDVSDYTAVFRAMLANQGGFTTVFFSSDEPAVYKEMAAALEHPEERRRLADGKRRWRVMPFPPGEDAATQLVSVPLRYWRVMGAGGGSAYDQLARGAAGDSAVVRVGASETRTKPAWDEGMLLMAQAFLFAGCGGFVGTLDSNVARLVWELSSALAGSEQPNVFDMNGALWHPGWAASESPYRDVQHHPRHCPRAPPA